MSRRIPSVGGSTKVPFLARLVTATSRHLAEAVKTGDFREDLYYRISAFEIRIPSLRDRMEDLPLLAAHFLKDTGVRLERETLAVLQSYSFPGNVRELQNVLKQARAVCRGKSILPSDLPGEIMLQREAPPIDTPRCYDESLLDMKREDALDEIERQFDRAYLPRKLDEAAGNKVKAADSIGVTAKTLRQKLKDCGLGHLIRRNEEQP